ncbi:MAG: hypothetical protein ACI4QS_09710 [Comamonas sp.]
MATSVVNPRVQFFANNGRPLIGGRIHTYVAGSSTRARTYKDAAKAQPNTNPIILDGRGEAQIYLAEGVEYKFVVEDSKGALIYTQEPVYGAIWPNAEQWPSDATLSYQYMTEAKAAAGAIGPIKFYDTLAQAQGDLANLTEGDLVEIAQDEEHDGARTRRRFLEGTFVFVANLDQLRADLTKPSGNEVVGGFDSLSKLKTYTGDATAASVYGGVGSGVWRRTSDIPAGVPSLHDGIGRAWHLDIPSGAARSFDVALWGGDTNAALAATGKAYIYEDITLDDDIVLTSDQELKTIGNAKIILNGNRIRTDVLSSDAYWRDTPGNEFKFFSSSSLIGSSAIELESSSGLHVGDTVWVRNGYCDQWRFLGDTVPLSIAKYEWLRKGPYLGEFVKITAITGNTLSVEPPLSHNYNLTPSVTGLIPGDENNRADYAGYNKPSVQKILYKDIDVNVSVVFEPGKPGAVRLDFIDGLKCKIHSTGQSTGFPIEARYSIWEKVEANSEDLTGGAFATTSCKGNITGRSTRWRGGADCPYVAMLQSDCNIVDINAHHATRTGERYAAYVNACTRGTMNNINADGFTAPVCVSFSAGIISNNLVGKNCDVAAGAYTSADCKTSNVILDGYYQVTAATTESDSVLYLRGQSKNAYESIKRMNDLGYGQMFINVASEGIKLRDISAPNTRFGINIGTTATELAKVNYSLKVDADGMDILGISRSSSYYDGTIQNGVGYPRVRFKGICRGDCALGGNSAFDEYDFLVYGHVTLGNISTHRLKGVIHGNLNPVSGQESTCYLSAKELRVVGVVSGFNALTAIISAPPTWWYRGQEVTDMTTWRHYRYTGNRGGGALISA